MSQNSRMPPGYWTKDRCAPIAKKYSHLNAWIKGHRKSYRAAKGQPWFEEITAHMTQKMSPPGSWNEDRCSEEAAKYFTLSEWKKGHYISYINSLKQLWFNKITAHMTDRKKNNGYWQDPLNVFAEAFRYDSLMELRKQANGAYKAALKGNFIDRVKEIYGGDKSIKWTRETVIAEAQKYKNRNDFSRGSPGAYYRATQDNYLDEACAHMELPKKPIEVVVGYKQGRLTVIELGHKKYGKPGALCRCECGNERVYLINRFIRNQLQSCGCKRDEDFVERSTKHGMSYSIEYQTWASIKTRLRIHPRYKNVTMAEEWSEDFNAFYQYVGPAPSPEHTIDRIDVNGNYVPGNVRWATQKEQARNKTNNLIIEYEGERHCLSEWSEIKNIPRDTLSWRLNHWKNIDRVMNEPVNNTGPEKQKKSVKAPNKRSPRKVDTVYLWAAIEHTSPETFLVKAGNCVFDRVNERVRIGAQNAGLEYRLIDFRYVGVDNAKYVEEEMLRNGKKPNFDISFEGMNDFRLCFESEIREMLKIMHAAEIEH